MISIQHNLSDIDWECLESVTQYLTHGIHRYSGKFIPQIASNAISLLTEKDDLILDLYSGSGTTLLEAALNERKSIGIDLNPLAVLVSKVKTTPIDKKLLYEWMKCFSDLINVYSADNTQQQLSLFQDDYYENTLNKLSNDYRLNDSWYKKWFQPNALKELVWIDLNIKDIRDDNLRALAFVVLSDILRKSSNAHGSYPNVMFDKNKPAAGPVIPKYIKRLNQIVESVSELSDLINNSYIPKIIEANNTFLPIKSESIDAIITHPPYIGSVPYAEYGLLSITWMGRCPKTLDATLTGGQRQRKVVVDKFFDDYAKMFKEAYRVLKSEKYMFILVGNPTVRGEKVDLTKASIKYASEAGFSLDTKITRSGANRRANLMGDESIIFFRK